jgi:hypothetical protein
VISGTESDFWEVRANSSGQGAEVLRHDLPNELAADYLSLITYGKPFSGNRCSAFPEPLEATQRLTRRAAAQGKPLSKVAHD